ncbi:hypothetical protein AAMO2058_001056300 [Amorphochlora amoebiformis]
MGLVEVPITDQRRVTMDGRPPVLVYYEVKFGSPVQVGFLCFRNFYCASISVKGLAYIEEGKANWKIMIRRHPLMKDPHFEDDAQDQHIISSQQFEESFGHRPVTAVRFYLYQPSPNWESYNLMDMRCYTTSKALKGSSKESLLENKELKIKSKSLHSALSHTLRAAASMHGVGGKNFK